MSTTRPAHLETVPPQTRRIDGRGEFQAAVREALRQAAERGDTDLVLCDADFADWPLGEREVIASLESWARPRRRMTVFAANYDEVVRRHPRWVAWRRTWAHLVECRAVAEQQAAACPTMLLVPTGPLTIRLHDPQRLRGVLSSEPRDATAASELLEALHQHTVESFSPTTLGL